MMEQKLIYVADQYPKLVPAVRKTVANATSCDEALDHINHLVDSKYDDSLSEALIDSGETSSSKKDTDIFSANIIKSVPSDKIIGSSHGRKYIFSIFKDHKYYIRPVKFRDVCHLADTFLSTPYYQDILEK